MEGKREKFSISLEMSGISTDLVQKFTKQNRNQEGSEQEEEEEEDEELELSLGLSLNGRFGVNPVRKKLKRSSSISNLVLGVGGVENSSTRVVEFETYAPLPRTRSLPTEAEEEWRRGKEFQSMRRMEARKKRMEKLRNVRVLKDKVSCVESGNGLNHLHGGIEISSSQGSLGSQRSGTASSGISDLEFEGTRGNQKADLPHRLQDQSKPASKAAGKDSTMPNESTKNELFDMPYVSTKEDGPNGHKIEGFLYRYKKGEEVRIVCVCHGMFLTPAEFIKHGGGGGDVEHPLKHIVVTPFPLL